MYTAVIVLFFAAGQVALELHPAETAVDAAQCEEHLDLLQERIDAQQLWLMRQHGLILGHERMCILIGEPA